MIYNYLKEIIKRINIILFGLIFSILLTIIYKEELVFSIINLYFKIFKFQILLLTGIFDKIYFELTIIYIILIINFILLLLINFFLFCIPIITYKKLNKILINIYYIIFLIFYNFIINLSFILFIFLIKKHNIYYIYINMNIINEISLLEYKNFLLILIYINFCIFLIGIFIFFIIIKIKNISYNYFNNMRILNFILLSIILIFVLPPDYFIHFIFLIYYIIYIEGLFFLTIFLKEYKNIMNK